MAGPVAGVLIASTASPDWRATLDGTIGLIGRRGKDDDVFVETTRPLGGSYEGQGRRFLIGVEDLERPLAEEYWPVEATETPASFYERVFGVVPDERIYVAAMSNRPEDHRILGELVAGIAERLDGIIDVGGLLIPLALYGASVRRPDGTHEWSAAIWPSEGAFEAAVEAFTSSMPGRVTTGPYGSEFLEHTVDAPFIRAWLRHPDFRMIK